MPTNVQLTAKQQRAISAILSERTTIDAAKKVGVNEKTIRRWMVDPTFKAALQAAEAALIDQTVRRLAAISSNAVLLLEWALGKADKDSTKVRAADIILSKLMSLKELADLEGRIAALEQQPHDD